VLRQLSHAVVVAALERLGAETVAEDDFTTTVMRGFPIMVPIQKIDPLPIRYIRLVLDRLGYSEDEFMEAVNDCTN
jgi:hypothetical protein